MPIKGLTDRPPRFPQIGELRKGGEKDAKGQWGQDLTYFRFTSTDENVVADFIAEYGDEPQAINIFLPYATTDDNFHAWMEEYSAGGLIHRCDGEFVIRYQKDGVYIDPEYGTMPCPYANGEKQRTKKNPGCTNNGRLFLIIPELRRLAYVVAGTHSINDIVEMTANLRAYEVMEGDLRGIPFVFSRIPVKISTPSGVGSKRARRTKWLWHIEASPAWVAQKISAMNTAALPEPSQSLFLADAADIETGEIYDESPEPEPTPTQNDTRQFHALGTNLYGADWDEKRHELVSAITKGRTASSKELSASELAKLTGGMADKMLAKNAEESD